MYRVVIEDVHKFLDWYQFSGKFSNYKKNIWKLLVKLPDHLSLALFVRTEIISNHSQSDPQDRDKVWENLRIKCCNQHQIQPHLGPTKLKPFEIFKIVIIGLVHTDLETFEQAVIRFHRSYVIAANEAYLVGARIIICRFSGICPALHMR